MTDVIGQLECPPYGQLSTTSVRVGTPFPPAPRLLLGWLRASSPAGAVFGAALGLAEDDVRVRSLGELVERVSSVRAGVPDRLARMSVDEAARQYPVVTPASLLHFAPWQRVRPLLHPANGESVLSWCRGERLATGEPVLVPAHAAFLRWRPPPGEPAFLRPGSTGLAAHSTRPAALSGALLEVLERDALMLSWRVPGWPVRRLEPDLVEPRLAQACRCLDLEIRLYALGRGDLPPTVLALLHGEGRSQLTCSSACGWGPRLADKAVYEGLMLQWTMRNHRGEGSSPPTSMLGHVARAFRRGADVIGWYERQAESRTPQPSADEPPGDVAALAHRVEAVMGGTVVAVDTRDRLAEECGWHVYRVIASNALPCESDHRITHLGGPRVVQELRRLDRTDQDVRRDPHPFG